MSIGTNPEGLGENPDTDACYIEKANELHRLDQSISPIFTA